MSERKLRTCSVCRQKYKFCPHCGEDRDKPTWYFIFCSTNCKNIYEATSGFENGQISREEAKTELDKLDLSREEYLGLSYKASIRKIYENVQGIVDKETLNAEESKQIEVIHESDSVSEKDTKKSKKVKKIVNNAAVKNIEEDVVADL